MHAESSFYERHIDTVILKQYVNTISLTLLFVMLFPAGKPVVIVAGFVVLMGILIYMK